MFGCLVAGRPLQTNLVQVDDTHAYFELQQAGQINHICVFMLGTVPFPDGLGAAVHFFWPGKGFQLLGMISNDKPSAIFRLRGTFTSAGGPGSAAQQAFTQAQALPGLQNGTDQVVAVLGLSIEPLEQIYAQISSLPSNAGAGALVVAGGGSGGPQKEPVWLAEKIVQNMVNYVNGFLVNGNEGIPMNVFMKWYENFTRKVKSVGVGFLEES